MNVTLLLVYPYSFVYYYYYVDDRHDLSFSPLNFSVCSLILSCLISSYIDDLDFGFRTWTWMIRIRTV
jgi:hypothetical protein